MAEDTEDMKAMTDTVNQREKGQDILLFIMDNPKEKIITVDRGLTRITNMIMITGVQTIMMID